MKTMSLHQISHLSCRPVLACLIVATRLANKGSSSLRLVFSKPLTALRCPTKVQSYAITKRMFAANATTLGATDDGLSIAWAAIEQYWKLANALQVDHSRGWVWRATRRPGSLPCLLRPSPTFCELVVELRVIQTPQPGCVLMQTPQPGCVLMQTPQPGCGSAI